MTPNEYVQNALRTESKIDKLVTNEYAIAALLDVIIAAGNMLDQFKKNTFYNKPFDEIKFNQHRDNVIDAIQYFRDIPALKHPTKVKLVVEDINPRLFHGAVGIITEATEVAEGLKKVFDGQKADTTNLMEEVGDLSWYEAILVDSLNGDLEQVMERNVAKLKARFPDKFTSEDALNRDLEKERAILEGKNG